MMLHCLNDTSLSSGSWYYGGSIVISPYETIKILNRVDCNSPLYMKEVNRNLVETNIVGEALAKKNIFNAI